MKLTASQHQTNLDELATYTLDTMRGMTVKYLREKLAGVNIANVTRGTELVQISRARKEEIIEAIMVMTTKPKVLAQVVLTELSPSDIREGLEGLLHSTDMALSTFTEKLFNDLRTYTLGQWDATHERWKMDTQYPQTLSLSLTVWLEAYRTVDGEPLCGDTKVVYASRIRNAVKKLINTKEGTAIYHGELLRHYELMKVHNHGQMAEYTREKKVTQKARATLRQGNSQAINPDALIEAATALLTRNYNGEAVRWHDLSVALVLVTGRRPSEIHATAKFTPVMGGTNYQLQFDGQLKKKEAVTEAYVIPTLVPNHLVIRGMETLQRMGKYYANEPEKAHKRVSNEVSKYGIKPWYSKFLPEVSDYVDESTGKAVNVRTHYRMREIYALVALERHMKALDKHQSGSDMVRYVASILGHDDNSKAYDAYDANFYIKRESV
mgnify:CR=1 FL=1